MISVVIPLYNKGPHIGKTLDSVLAQTVPPAEIIVIDDGSTDEGPEIVRAYLNRGVRLIRQTNQGVSAARNRGVEEATCEYVAFLDADDWWMPNHIEVLLNLIQKYPEAALYSTAFAILRDGIYLVPRLAYSKNWIGIVDNFFLRHAQGTSLVSSSTSCVNKVKFLNKGGFPVGIHHGEDLIAWWNLALDYPVAHAEVVTAIYNQDAVNRACQNQPPSGYCDQFLVSLLNQNRLSEWQRKSVALLFDRTVFLRAARFVMNGDRPGLIAIRQLAWNAGRYKIAFLLYLLPLVPASMLRWAQQWRYKVVAPLSPNL